MLEEFNVNYLNRGYKLKTCEVTKINGIFLQQDPNEMLQINVLKATERMEKTFSNWSRCGLSTLGKIIIAKTFGISQVIFLMQSLSFKTEHFKKINALLYKFIWNRHFHASKAPERVKREIVNKPIALGGFGMLDITELDASIKLKALGRLFITSHPMLMLIKNKVNLSEFFYPSCLTSFDPVTSEGIRLLGLDRRKLLTNEKARGDRKAVMYIGDMKLSRIIKPGRLQSILYFNVWSKGCRKVKDINRMDLNQLKPLIIGDYFLAVENAVVLKAINRQVTGELARDTVYINKTFKNLTGLSSQDIRLGRSNKNPIVEFKLGISLSGSESLNCFTRIKKLSSTKHKDTLIWIVHNEVYTKVKLYKYGLSDSPICPRCPDHEDLKHKIIHCQYADRIWSQVARTTNTLRLNPIATMSLSNVIGADADSNLTILTINAEICQRILYLKDRAEYLIHPKRFVELAIRAIQKKESNSKIKTILGTLLSE